jgi:hypothetical protein
MKGLRPIEDNHNPIDLLFITFSLLSLFQTLYASCLLISMTKDGVLRLAGHPKAHQWHSHPDTVPPG